MVLGLGQKLYFRGVVGNSSNGGGVKNKKIKTNKAYRAQPVAISYIKKEFKTLVKNPVYFMQCILPAIMMPVLFLIIFLAGSNSQEEELAIGDIMSTVNPFVIILVVVGILQFLSMMIYISATAISRDGKNAMFIKYIPISLHKQFIYKMMPNVIMNIIAMLIVFILIYIALPISLWLYVPIFIIGLLFAIINSYIGLFVDLRKPKLEWDTEYAVVKQNMNLIWPMLFGLLGISVIVAFGILCSILGFDAIISAQILILILCLVIYLLDRYVEKKQAKLFEKIF